MDLLKRHYEKVLLGISLLGLLLGSYLLLRSLKTAAQDVHDVQTLADQVTAGTGSGKRIEPVKDKVFDAPAALQDPRILLGIAGSAGSNVKGSLLEPASYLRCVNPECMYLIPYDRTKCPFCSTVLPKGDISDDPDSGEDTDKDGIPDRIEVQNAFLNAEDPSDAMRDQDRDDFTNVEESRLKTKMDDANSFPPLAENLRYVRVFRNPLPVTLKKISTIGSDDPTKWIIICTVPDRGGRLANKVFSVGQTVGDFEITNARIRTEEKENPRTHKKETLEVPEIVLASKAKPDDKYTLVAGVTAHEKDLYVLLIYLSNRNDPRRCLRIQAKEGDQIRLTHTASRQVQTYTVTKVSEEAIKVVRNDKDVPATEYTIPMWRREDFVEAEQGRTEPGPEGAEGAMPGMAPGMAPAPGMPGMAPGGRGGRR